MSTTATSSGSDIEETNAQKFFQSLVHQSGVCDNCFNRTHYVEKEWWPEWVRLALTKHLQNEKYYPEPTSIEKVYPKSKDNQYPSSRNICECGVLLPFMKVRPLSRSELERNIDNLCELMDDEEYSHNKRLLIREAHKKKSQPEYQSRDEAIFIDALREVVL
jgi:hypothetical protein